MLTDRKNKISGRNCSKLCKHCMLSEKAGKLLHFANAIFVMSFSGNGNLRGFLVSSQSPLPMIPGKRAQKDSSLGGREKTPN